MAKFNYEARDGGGNLACGVVNAANSEEAAGKLRDEGKYIVKLSPIDEAEQAEEQAVSRSRSVRRREVIFFAHQMAVMIETGVPLTEALECTMEQTTDEHFRAILFEVSRHVKGGGEFSAALEQFPRAFPPAMTSIIRASEVSGTMAIMLNRLAVYLTKEEATVRQARGAMLYPLFMLFMAVSVTVFLLVAVLPRFAGIYEARQATLPAPTRMLLAMSGGLLEWWYIWATVALAAFAALVLIRRVRFGKRTFDWLKLHTPVAQGLFTQLYITRTCRTMGTMVAAGVTMLDMIAIVRHVTDNFYFDELWDEVDDRLRQGAQLSDPLFTSPLFPRSIAQMIHSGEKSGQLAKVLNRIADFTEAEFDQAVKNTTQFIEPLMVAVMGGIIGFIAISLLLPIFNVGRVMSGG